MKQPRVENLPPINDTPVRLVHIGEDHGSNSKIICAVRAEYPGLSMTVHNSKTNASPERAFWIATWPTLLDGMGAKLELVTFAGTKPNPEYFLDLPDQWDTVYDKDEFLDGVTANMRSLRVDTDVNSMLWRTLLEEHEGKGNIFATFLDNKTDEVGLTAIAEQAKRTTTDEMRPGIDHTLATFHDIFTAYAERVVA